MPCSCQCRYAWTDEGAVLAVMIDPGTSRQRQFRRQREVVLRECAGHAEVIVESRHIPRRIGVTFQDESGDPRLAACVSTDGGFAKGRIVPIALTDFAELVVVALSRYCRARGHNISTLDEELRECTGVVASRLQGLDIGLARRLQHLAIRRAAVAILVGKAGGGKERSAAAAVPEHPGTHDASRISREVSPRIAVDVIRLL